MASLLKIEAQQGEWWEVGAVVTNPQTGQPRDISGKAVTLTVRAGLKDTDQLVALQDATTAVLDGAGGSAMGGARNTAAGHFYGSITIGQTTDGPGWPVKDRFELKITDCP